MYIMKDDPILRTNDILRDKLLAGLLPPEFDKKVTKLRSFSPVMMTLTKSKRVLLVDPGNHIPTLFCEHFPYTISWFLPKDFFIADQFKSFDPVYAIPLFIYVQVAELKL
nr:galactoside 2-alpha-L-fucosyltransferase-like [Ipomoea batatas]